MELYSYSVDHVGKSMRRCDLDPYEYRQFRLLGTMHPCQTSDVEIHAIYSKFNKVVCVIKMGVLLDTDFNCFFYAIVPPYLTHAAECHVAL